MDKDRNRTKSCTRCNKPSSRVNLCGARQQRACNDDIFYDCVSISDSDMPKEGNPCKNSLAQKSMTTGFDSVATSGNCKYDDPEVVRAALERAAYAAQMLLKNMDGSKTEKQSCNATLEITARLITNTNASNSKCRLQGRPVTVQMPLQFDPKTCQMSSSPALPCQGAASKSTDFPALIYTQDERYEPNGANTTQSFTQQTDKSHLKQVINNTSNAKCLCEMPMTQKEDQCGDIKNPQTNTSFLYEKAKRKSDCRTDDKPSQTNIWAMKTDNMRYPTQFVPCSKCASEQQQQGLDQKPPCSTMKIEDERCPDCIYGPGWQSVFMAECRSQFQQTDPKSQLTCQSSAPMEKRHSKGLPDCGAETPVIPSMPQLDSCVITSVTPSTMAGGDPNLGSCGQCSGSRSDGGSVYQSPQGSRVIRSASAPCGRGSTKQRRMETKATTLPASAYYDLESGVIPDKHICGAFGSNAGQLSSTLQSTKPVGAYDEADDNFACQCNADESGALNQANPSSVDYRTLESANRSRNSNATKGKPQNTCTLRSGGRKSNTAYLIMESGNQECNCDEPNESTNSSQPVDQMTCLCNDEQNGNVTNRTQPQGQRQPQSYKTMGSEPRASWDQQGGVDGKGCFKGAMEVVKKPSKYFDLAGVQKMPIYCEISERSVGCMDKTSSRSQSVMAKVTCLCSSEEKVKLMGMMDGNGAPPFARQESVKGPCCTDERTLASKMNSTCTSASTKVVYMNRADRFCDCGTSSGTSLGKQFASTGPNFECMDQSCQEQANTGHTDSYRPMDCCDQEASQNPPCSAQPFTGLKSPTDFSESCITSSQRGGPMPTFNMESVGVVMDCQNRDCPVHTAKEMSSYKDCDPHDKCITMDSITQKLTKLTESNEPSDSRNSLIQELFRDVAMMLRPVDKCDEEEPLCYEDCMTAVTEGRLAPKKPPSARARRDQEQCFDQIEKFLNRCFPVKTKPAVDLEVIPFEVDPNFDPYAKVNTATSTLTTFRSCNMEPSQTDTKTATKESCKAQCSKSMDSKLTFDSKLTRSSDNVPPGDDGVMGDESKDEVKIEIKLEAKEEGIEEVNDEVKDESKAESKDDNSVKKSSEGEPPQDDCVCVEADDVASEPVASDMCTICQETAIEEFYGVCDNCEELEKNPCGLCDIGDDHPLSPLTDRERLLCEYMMRRMCELCGEEPDEGEEESCDICKDKTGEPCVCCHCRALMCDNKCKTVANTLDQIRYDPVAETKFFIDSIICDLQAMDHVMQQNKIKPMPTKPSPTLGKAIGESFPVTITNVSSLGCHALYVVWQLEDCAGVGGYEIYVDGHLTNRFYSFRHVAGVVTNIDVTKRHQIVLRAQAVGQEFAGDDSCRCAGSIVDAHPEMLVGACRPWTPSVYLYEP